MEEYIYDNEGGLKRIQYSGNRYLQTVMFSIAIYSIAIFLCFKVLLETLQTGENRGAIFVIIGALTVLSIFFFAMINSYVVISFEDDKVVFQKLFRKMIIPYFELKVISHIPYKHAGNVSSYNHYRSTIYFSSKANVDSKKIAIRLSGKFLSGKSGTIKDYLFYISVSDRGFPGSKGVYFAIKEKISKLCPDNTIDFRAEDPNKAKYW